MKIIFVTLGFLPFRTSGFDISGERLVNALLDHGHQVHIIAARKKTIEETYIRSGLSIQRLPMGHSDWIGYALRVASALRAQQEADIIHFWDGSFSFAYHGRFIASLHQSFHQRITGLDMGLSKSTLKLFRRLYYFGAQKFIEAKALNRANGLLAVSNATREEYINTYKVSPEKIMIARHGLDCKFFSPSSDRRTIRAKMGFAPSEPILLFTGFITPRKGLEYLAMAFPLIRPSPRLIIAGTWKNKEYCNQIRRLFKPYGDKIFEIGFIPDKYMPNYYSLADIYVSSSLLEGFGLPLGEALACETPVVAFDTGAVSEVVGPGGVLVPPKDIYGLANAISFLLQNPDIRRKMGIEGRQHVMREFSIETMLQSTLEGYEHFLGVGSTSKG